MILIGTFALGTDIPDAKLLDRCIREIKNGNKEALATLYEHTRVAVFSFAMAILKNREDAEDVLQDVYLSLAGTVEDFDEKGKTMAWLMLVTKHLALTKLRKNSRRCGMLIDAKDPSDEIGRADDRATLEACLNKLDDEEREIVILHAVSGLKHREIAAVLHLKPGTVGSKYARALKKLEKELTKGGAFDAYR